jgi:hypothetical protein
MKRVNCIVDGTCSCPAGRTRVLILGLAVAWTASAPRAAWGQWNGTNPIWTNSNVGIGTASPSSRLMIAGTGNQFTESERFPFLALDSALAEDPHQQSAADVLRMRIRNAQLSTASPHVLVIATGNRRIEAQSAQTGNQFSAFDGTNGGHSRDFANFDAMAFDVRYRSVIGDTEKNPPFQNALQFFAATLQGLGVGPHAGNGGDFAIERTIVLYDFVPCLAHGGPNVRRQHVLIISLQAASPAGNVGIGTAAPQYKLAVNGVIGAKEVIVTNTGWPDYVFRPGYRVRPLSDNTTPASRGTGLTISLAITRS